MEPPNIYVVRVDYMNPQQCQDLVRLLREYHELETDAAEPVQDDVFAGLPSLLAEFPTAFSLLAYRDREAVGLVNCFFGFSTFQQKRLVNIHDVMVTGPARGQGIAGMMLQEVERIARQQDCCRITLEMLAANTPAWRAYEKQGFGRTPYHPDQDTLFLQKPLSADQ